MALQYITRAHAASPPGSSTRDATSLHHRPDNPRVHRKWIQPDEGIRAQHCTVHTVRLLRALSVRTRPTADGLLRHGLRRRYACTPSLLYLVMLPRASAAMSAWPAAPKVGAARSGTYCDGIGCPLSVQVCSRVRSIPGTSDVLCRRAVGGSLPARPIPATVHGWKLLPCACSFLAPRCGL